MSDVNELMLEDFGLITVEDAAARRGVTAEAVRTWIKKGLPFVPVGKGRNQKNLIPITQLDAFTPLPRGRPKEGEEAPKPEPKKRGRKKK